MNCEEIKNKLSEYCKKETNKNTKNSVCFSYNNSFIHVTEKWLWTELSRIQIIGGYIVDVRETDNGLEIEIEINRERFVELIKGYK